MYSFPSRIRFSECSADNCLSLSGLVNYFQDCAVFHSVNMGRGPKAWKEEQYAWLVATWRILVKEYPALGEEITTRTWCYRFHGIEGDRNVDMLGADGRVLAVADSRWIYYDAAAGRPVHVPDVEVEGYGLDQRLELPEAPRHIRIPAEGVQEKFGIKVRTTNLDTNGHVNNEQYIRLALAYLPADIRVRELRVEYHVQAVLGDILVPRVYQVDGEYIIWFEVDGKKCCVLQFIV